MAKAKDEKNLPVTFVDLKDDEEAPCFAVYQLDNGGRPVKKLGRYDGKVLKVDIGNIAEVTFGPDVDDFKSLPRQSLVSYRVAEKIDLWREQAWFYRATSGIIFTSITPALREPCKSVDPGSGIGSKTSD